MRDVPILEGLEPRLLLADGPDIAMFITAKPADPLKYLNYNLGYTAGVYKPGDWFTVTWAEENLGTLNAVPNYKFPLQARLSLDRTWGNADDVIIGEIELDGGLPATEFRYGTMQVTLPTNMPAGRWWVAVMADPNDIIVEDDNLNNVDWSSAADIIVYTDLRVYVNMFTPGTYYPGEWLKVYGTVINDGLARISPSSKVKVEARLTNDLNIGDADDVVIYSARIKGVSAKSGSVGRLEFVIDNFQIPSTIAAGDYYLYVKVDVDDVIDETSEANNEWWSTLGDIVIDNSYHVRKVDRSHSTTFYDSKGNKVKVSLKGAGTVRLFFSAADYKPTDIWADMQRIDLSGTNGTSSLTIKVNSTTTLGQINMGSASLKSLSASKVNLIGAGITTTGASSIASIKLGAVTGGADINLPGTGVTKGVALQAISLGSGTDIILGSPLKTFKVGATSASLTVSNPDSKGYALRTAKITGNLTGTWTLTGSVKKARLASVNNWNLVTSGGVSDLRAGSVGTASLTATGNGIAKLRVSRWNAGTINTKWIGRLWSDDDFRPNVTLSATNVDGYSIRRAWIRGDQIGTWTYPANTVGKFYLNGELITP